MLSSALVMIAGFIPVEFVASSAGEYYYSLFMVVLISLVSSWVVAVLFSPLRHSFITVQTDIAPRLKTPEVSKNLAPSVEELRKDLPPIYHITEGGSVVEVMKGNSSVFSVLSVAILVMLILLMVQLRSFSHMILALLIAPFGLIGFLVSMLPT